MYNTQQLIAIDNNSWNSINWQDYSTILLPPTLLLLYFLLSFYSIPLLSKQFIVFTLLNLGIQRTRIYKKGQLSLYGNPTAAANITYIYTVITHTSHGQTYLKAQRQKTAAKIHTLYALQKSMNQDRSFLLGDEDKNTITTNSFCIHITQTHTQTTFLSLNYLHQLQYVKRKYSPTQIFNLR